MTYNKNDVEAIQSVALDIFKDIDKICRNNGIQYWLEAGTLLGAVRHGGYIPWDDDLDISMMRQDFNKFLNIAKDQLASNHALQHSLEVQYVNVVSPVKIRDKNSVMLDDSEVIIDNYDHGIFVDIFVYDYLPKNKSLRKFYKYLAKTAFKCKRELVGTSTRRKHSKAFVNKLIGKSLGEKNLLRIINYLIERKEKRDIIGFGYDSTLKSAYDTDEIFPLKEIEFEGIKTFSPQNPDYVLTAFYGNYMEPPPEEERTPKHLHKLVLNIKDK